jgi:hypothetical protein
MRVDFDVMDFIRWQFGREIPDDPDSWHKRNMLWPVRCLDGRWARHVWRRRQDRAWEYIWRDDKAPRDDFDGPRR